MAPPIESTVDDGSDVWEYEPSEPYCDTEDDFALAKALSNIDASQFASFLANELANPRASGSELTALVAYLENALDGVPYSQFPWPKLDNLLDVIDRPMYQIPQPVYRAASNFIRKYDITKAGVFILWAFRIIRNAALSKTIPNTIPLRSHLATFVAFSIVLRSQRPGLTMLLPLFAVMEPFKAHDKLPILVWMIAQVTQVDLSLGLYMWAHNLLPLADDKHICDPPELDLILQLVEYIVSYPYARYILLKNAVQEGIFRLVSPPLFETFLRLTFPASSKRQKDTERFEAVYPLLREVALTHTPTMEATEQLTLEIFTVSLKLAGEGNPVLAKEATSIAIWCLTKNVDCCNHWDNLYYENSEASVALLRKLVDELKDDSLKLSSSPSDTLTLRRTMKSFMLKNKKHITEGGANVSFYKEADKYCKEISWRLSRGFGFLKGIANASLYKEADKYCKEISGRLSGGSGFLKGIAISVVVLVVAIAAALVVLFNNLVGSFERYKYVMQL